MYALTSFSNGSALKMFFLVVKKIQELLTFPLLNGNTSALYMLNIETFTIFLLNS